MAGPLCPVVADLDDPVEEALLTKGGACLLQPGSSLLGGSWVTIGSAPCVQEYYQMETR